MIRFLSMVWRAGLPERARLVEPAQRRVARGDVVRISSWGRIARYAALGLLSSTAFLGCQELTMRQNYGGFRDDSEIAVFAQRGHKFRLQGDLNSPVDRLQLVPGSYMIEFIDQYSQIRGAAYCDVKAGVVYQIEPRGYRDFPDLQKRMIVGGCVAQPQEKE